MFEPRFGRIKRGMLLKRSVAVVLLAFAMLTAPFALALQKFPSVNSQVSFENATDNGHLFASGDYIVRHRGDETQIGFTITNNSEDIIDGPYRLVLKHFFALGRVDLEGVDGFTQRGYPYVLLNTQLAPGETSAPIEMMIKSAAKKHRGWFSRHFGAVVYFKLSAQRVIETLYDSKADFTANVLAVLDPNADFNSPDFNHSVNGRLIEVAHAIHLLAVLDDIDDADLSRLLSYLNVYGTNGPAGLDIEQASILDKALVAVSNMSDFRTTSATAASVVQGYVLTLQNFYNRESAIPNLGRHLFTYAQLISFYDETSNLYDYENLGESAFETIKSYANLFYSGKSNADLAQVLLADDKLLFALVELGDNRAAMVPPNNHPAIGERYNTYVMDWVLWGYAQHWLVANGNGNAEVQTAVDNAARSLVDAYQGEGVLHEVLKAVLYKTFLGNTRSFEQAELCNNDFAAQCLTDRGANPEIFTRNILELLNPQTNYYSFDFPHTAADRLNDLIAAINFLAEQDELADPALEKLLDYIDSYAYFSGVDLTEDEALAVHQAYLAVAGMRDFLSTREPAGRVMKKYFFGLRNLYSNEPALSVYLADLLPTLVGIMDFYVADEDFRSHPGFNDAVFELVKKVAYLAYDGYGNVPMTNTLLTPAFLDALQRMASDEQVIFSSDSNTLTMDWFLWGMSNLWWDAWWNWDDAAMADLDNRVRAIIDAHAGYPSFEILKSVVLRSYIYGTNRSLDVCNTEFANQCGEIDITKIFPDTLECRDVSVKIIAQDMTEQQLSDSCASMTAQEIEFHNTMGTNRDVPVADDYNEMLNVVIFADTSQYKALGTALFNINTDNGGIFIETDPADSTTQATFYAHEAQWLRPDFVVWNLDHEFVHYLDGRYIQYGGFSHFPEADTVWWQEGLAEFFGQGTDNSSALSLLSSIDERNWPTLDEITHISYAAATDMVYGWSYWVHRFMHANHQVEIIGASELLKSGTDEDLAAFQTTINNWAAGYQDEFVQYLRDQRDLEASLSALFGQTGSNASNAAGYGQHGRVNSPDEASSFVPAHAANDNQRPALSLRNQQR